MRKRGGIISTVLALTLGVAFFVSRGEEKSASESEGSPSVLERFSAEEQERLLAGQPVYQHAGGEGGESQGRRPAQASILIHAPLESSWSIFCEFDKHHLYFPRKTRSEVIKREGENWWVRKEFNFYGATVHYTVRYTTSLSPRRVEFVLAPAYPHDIKDTGGYFLFEKVTDSQTLFTYAVTRLDPGMKIPKVIQEYLTSRDLPGVVINVKKRIESAGTWTKEE